MIPGRRLGVMVSGAGLAVMAIGAMWVAATVQAAPVSARAAATSMSYLPAIYAPPAPTPTGPPPPVTPPAATDWQTVLNYYRASARLPALAENTGWSAGAASHAQYMVQNETLANTEDPANPWYSQAGATEAANSNLMLSDNVATTDQQALDFWMGKPFHALGLIDPALQSTGFGSYRYDFITPYKMGAVVDVRQGLGAISGAVQFPVRWPGDNTTVYLTSYDGNEQPDPLTSCPGYGAPSGLPIILQLGPGGSTLNVTGHGLWQGNTSLLDCEFDPGNYTNPIADLQALGRQILAASDAVVLIPQQPLTPGLSYTASVTVNGQTITWTFYVAL